MQTKIRAATGPLAADRMGIYGRFVKRPLDFLLSLLALVIGSPVLLIVSMLVRLKLGSPVLFRQKRPGLDGQVFEILKFRTMTDERDATGELLPDGVRLTRFGRLLRSTSLDELPELFNILKGEMSFVGPRPLLVQYLPLYTERQQRRHEARPGLTGLAQVSGRNAISWEEKLEHDVRYVDSITFSGDCRILLVTLRKVIARADVNSQTTATMEPFTGLESERSVTKIDIPSS